ncbi:MAG: T9SS type A sorting domain-containing protein [Bacteroidales bacterium]|nr:T9SS type A sorting domain-containing protein [Bacteroidales bacterium]MCF8402718.1 T9SS type A sorting domain-containing protein [Bacteroidales bacterium]
MKTLFTILISLCILGTSFAQQRAIVKKDLRDLSVKMESPALESQFLNPSFTSILKSDLFPPEEEIIGDSRYDDQANACTQNRVYLYEDGTVGATWTRAVSDPGYADRGTGYNYFDGNAWGSAPTAQIEEERVGWPSYAPWGENGEMTVAHGSAGLIISTRPDKGTGEWTYDLHEGPVGHEYLIWNRTVTSGPDHSRVHILGVTASTVYSGTPYEGLNGALVYSLSTDSGATWELENEILDGMTSDDYVGFDGDTYNFAEPKGDIVAFTVGEPWYDFFLMKSTDGGETFEKTVIWEHPYPLFDQQAPYATDTFYCVDGSHHPVIDNNGLVHVAFGINRAISDGTNQSWYPFVDGIGYWNENMPSFSNDLHALDPYGHPDSELIEDYNLIGWSQDIDGDDQLTFVGTGTESIGLYYVSLSSFPQLVAGNANELYLVYSSVTETFDNGQQNYRHLWARTSPNSGEAWGEFFDLTSDLVHIFDECVYPSCAPYTDDYVYLVYQTDNEPGVSIWGDLDPAGDNNINIMKVLRDDITGVNENKQGLTFGDVSQNYPNPFKEMTSINVNLRKTSTIKISIVNLVGQEVYTLSEEAGPGLNSYSIQANNLPSGVYFYTVKASDSAVTKKMIIE